MAIINAKSTYGVINTSNMEAVRTGKMKAQYSLDGTDFATINAENGMLLVADDFAGTVGLPTDTTDTNVYIVASENKDYEGKGEAYYSISATEGFLPRMLKPVVGDEFETQCVEWDDGTYADFAAVVAAIDTDAVYGETNASGNIRLVATATVSAATELKALASVTMPNGETGLKFVVNAIG